MKNVMFSALIGVVTLFSASNAFSTIAVLKEGSGFTAGGNLAPVFEFADSSNVVEVEVNDTFHHGNHVSWDLHRGDTGYAVGGEYSLFKFDLSSLGAGATINTAELRVFANNGNTAVTISTITTHDWNEVDVTGQSPIGVDTPGDKWGPLSDSDYSSADFTDPSGFDHNPAGLHYLVEDVTSRLQGAVDSPSTYYGWSVATGNHNIYLSEAGDSGQQGSVEYKPALFIDYTPGGAGTPGDFDGDSDVDGNDFLEWQRGNSSPGGALSASDLQDWQNGYAPLVATIGSVPEPSSLLLVSLGAILAMCRRGSQS